MQGSFRSLMRGALEDLKRPRIENETEVLSMDPTVKEEEDGISGGDSPTPEDPITIVDDSRKRALLLLDKQFAELVHGHVPGKDFSKM